MAETLRELVVSLSLSSDNFNANIKSVNQRIKEAESNFKLASAGVDGFENTVRGAAVQVDVLKKKLELQNQAVEQHEGRLKQSNAALDASRISLTKQAASLDGSKTAHAALKIEIEKAEAAHKAAVKATGDNSEESNRLGVAVLDLKDKEAALSKEIKDGEAKLASATKSVQRNEDAVSRAQTGLNKAKGEVKETTSALDKLTSGLGKVGAGLGVLAGKAVAAGESMQRMGRTLSTRVTAPLAALGAYAFKAAVDFESAFAGVRKTVNATEEEFAQLEQSVKNMSLEVPSNTTEIAGVMEAAGQLGIATENLEDYTRTMIDLGNSTNLSAEEAATAIAQFSNITGMGQDKAVNFGSALVDLGNNFATNEQAIMSMASRLAGAGAQVGLSEAQILGFATALSSVGIEAEAGGSAFSKVMTNMEVAVATGKNGLEDFAKVSGMTNEQFISAWKTEPAKAIESFIVGLSKMDEEGISAIATLDEMGISEVRLRDTLLRATNATEEFARAQSVAASAWAEGTALATEAEQRYGTVASQLEMLKNKVSGAAQSLGTEMVPMAKSVIAAVSGLIDRFMALDTEQKEQIIKWGAIAAAAGPALMIFGKFASGAGKTVQAVLAITRALRGLSMVQFGWIGIAVAGIAGLTAAIKLLNDAAPSLDKTLGMVFDRTDDDTVDRFNKAFEVTIETTVTADDYKTKVNDAISEIKNALSGIEGLGDVEEAQILQAILDGSGITVFKQALEELGVLEGKAAEITATYAEAMSEISTALEGLGLSQEAMDHIAEVAATGGDVEAAIIGYGVSETEAKDTADKVTGAWDKIAGAINELGLEPEERLALLTGATNDRALIGASLRLMGLPQTVVDDVLDSYDVATGSLTGKITGLLDEVAAALTDGKPDDPVTMGALEEKFRNYFKKAVDKVNGWAADEIAKLDVTSETYDADVANIMTKAEEMRVALEGQQVAALLFLSAMAGKSAEEVRARLGELAEVEEAVQRILAEIEAASAAASEQGAQASKITKAGSARDVETAGRAFGHEKRTRDNAMDALEARYQADLIELESKYDELGEAEYERQSVALAEKYKQDTAAALAAYEDEVNALLLGLGQSLEATNPELAAAIQDAINAQELQSEIQGILEKTAAGELDASMLTDGIMQAIKDATGVNLTKEELAALSPEEALGLMTHTADALEGAATEAFEGIDLDASWIDEALKGALDNHAFEGLDGYDMSTAEGKMKSLFEPVGGSMPEGLAAGVEESAEKAASAVETMTGGLGGAAMAVLEAKSPSRVFARIGDDIVSGLVLGVNRSAWRIKFAMTAMAQEAIRAAKQAFGISSPSKLFRDEIGRMMVRGIGVGVESETEAQRRTIANAARAMTASARDGVRMESGRTSNDNRNQSVTVKVDSMNINNRQDIETLAQRISALQRRAARGVGY